MARVTASMVGGLGAWYESIPLWPSERETDPCAPSPPWCDYTPFSDFITECQPIDPLKCQIRTFGPELSPESRRVAIEQGKAATDAYLRLNPEAAAAFQSWEANRGWYELDTAFLAEQSKYTAYALLGAAGLLALLLLRR